jgi:fatty-acyl-CoA synthase
MYPGTHAEQTPDKPAAIMAESGEVLTYRELDDRSNQLAQLLWAAGLRRGDGLSIFMENHLDFFVALWAGFRSGLVVTAINRYLQPDESSYILNDSGAKALITSARMGELAAPLPSLAPEVQVLLSVDGGVDGFDDLTTEAGRFPAERLASQPTGDTMLYSSGTTGRPKGIRRPMADHQIDDPEAIRPLILLIQGLLHGTQDTVYLSPAPLYHSAPLGFCQSFQALGATTVIMERFDAAAALQHLETYSITHSQWVPTMFSRILKLPEEQRTGFDWSAHQVAVHAAAPCPVEVKKQMFDLWGPIIYEYYAGTELNGFVFCQPEQWLERPGTVGQSLLGPVHICDELGAELPAGEAGTIYFEREAMPFEYHNAPDKTKGAQHPDHPNWSTLGDVGYVDDDGFVFLTDRKAFMIIAGGVNIYPQEIEDVLILHPKVADVAVFGVPNDDLGEEVKAVVQLEADIEPSDQIARELIDYASQHLARFKVPRTVDFRPELPRLPTGKLYKRLLRDEYWAQQAETST